MARNSFVILYILTCFINKSVFSQNDSYVLCDSILIIANHDYKAAKKRWLKVEQNYKIDPVYFLRFLNFSYEKGDTTYLKLILEKLIKENGLTKEAIKGYKFYSEISDGKSKRWFETVFENNHDLWLKNNYKKLEVISKINQLNFIDQYLSSIPVKETDSCTSKKEIIKKIQEQDLANLLQIKIISEQYGGLPNNFDHDHTMFGKIQVILYHNLRDSTNFNYKWNTIFPYLEEAYFKGKISSSFLHLYDKFLNDHYGYQYYGFLKNVPLKDEQTVNERRKKYKLELIK